MKTNIYVCDTCGAVTFLSYAYDVTDDVCGIVRERAVMKSDGDEAPIDTGYIERTVCAGKVEYYAYDDFDRFK